MGVFHAAQVLRLQGWTGLRGAGNSESRVVCYAVFALFAELAKGA